MDLLFSILIWAIVACLALAALMATIRIVRGPSIVDRMVGSDTLATVLICSLSADMAIRGHTTTLPLVLGLAMTASVGTMAVARFVSRDRPRRNYKTGDEETTADIAGAEADGHGGTKEGTR
ncbi:monovalent cation/H+ antiporter complex subunit F [Gulosibacter sp. 10]|uniref:monovalent cation/H+ antiporter complex subunit F n=1 Tax=Gulosibacter sp. 10 TaxID=1255570 RepID=UPI00097EA120|nr:monovalent cation/H+ antiporter complex subunit F [Gulosibacter sp. 10]SJM64857.1 Na(+) H(+) antiporter subunit F [Gulosibacter sp. 10]